MSRSWISDENRHDLTSFRVANRHFGGKLQKTDTIPAKNVSNFVTHYSWTEKETETAKTVTKIVPNASGRRKW